MLHSQKNLRALEIARHSKGLSWFFGLLWLGTAMVVTIAREALIKQSHVNANLLDTNFVILANSAVVVLYYLFLRRPFANLLTRFSRKGNREGLVFLCYAFGITFFNFGLIFAFGAE